MTSKGRQRRMRTLRCFLFSPDSSLGKPQSSSTGPKSRYQLLNPVISHSLFSCLSVQLLCPPKCAVLESQQQEQSQGGPHWMVELCRPGTSVQAEQGRSAFTSPRPPRVFSLPGKRDPTDNALCPRTHRSHCRLWSHGINGDFIFDQCI